MQISFPQIVPSNDNYVRVAALTTVMQLHDNVGNNGKAFVHQLMIKLLDKELSWAQKVAYRCYSAQHRLEVTALSLTCVDPTVATAVFVCQLYP